MPILTSSTAVGEAGLPSAGQPEKFCPDTVTTVPGETVSGIAFRLGILHDADGFGGSSTAMAAGAVSSNAAAEMPKTAIPRRIKCRLCIEPSSSSAAVRRHRRTDESYRADRRTESRHDNGAGNIFTG